MHVANGINMNDETNTGNDKHHDQSEGIDLKTKINAEVTSTEPSPDNLLKDMLSFWQHEIPDIDQDRGKKRQSHATASYESYRIFANFQPKKTVDDRPDQRKQRDQTGQF